MVGAAVIVELESMREVEGWGVRVVVEDSVVVVVTVVLVGIGVHVVLLVELLEAMVEVEVVEEEVGEGVVDDELVEVELLIGLYVVWVEEVVDDVQVVVVVLVQVVDDDDDVVVELVDVEVLVAPLPLCIVKWIVMFQKTAALL